MATARNHAPQPRAPASCVRPAPMITAIPPISRIQFHREAKQPRVDELVEMME